MKKLLILGAGGHGKVIADAAMLMKRWNQISFLDDKVFDRPLFNMYEVVRESSKLSDLVNEYEDAFVAIGNNEKRLQCLCDCQGLGYNIVTIIHPSAIVAESAEIKPGVAVLANAVINPDAMIGFGSIVNTGAVIEHDCCLEDGVHVSPNTTLAGGVKVGRSSWIGAGACVIENKVIGINAIIGAGAVVIDDIQDNTKVVGVPARELKSD